MLASVEAARQRSGNRTQETQGLVAQLQVLRDEAAVAPVADLPHLRTSVPGPRSLALAAELRRWESPNVTFVDPDGRFPIFWESARDCLVTDADGTVLGEVVLEDLVSAVAG